VHSAGEVWCCYCRVSLASFAAQQEVTNQISPGSFSAVQAPGIGGKREVAKFLVSALPLFQGGEGRYGFHLNEGDHLVHGVAWRTL
jgi:hypothetical protein